MESRARNRKEQLQQGSDGEMGKKNVK